LNFVLSISGYSFSLNFSSGQYFLPLLNRQ